ncbi:SDR family NAD(P)-dependent oxidoreductase, partial [Paenibacillus sinensis]
ESFGEGGDGYVPGEGVGAVLLKPLSKAIADGDQIYGVIKGTAINHGGKTNGYTVPSPNAQGSLIGQALKEAGVNPRTISYLEAHGTGTVLGDPIEITGLTRAFGKDTADRQFCAIGSVKSNIGHCEGAAGIAGLTKVLLQFKNGQIAPSLHSKMLNPNIDFKETPFVVQQELTEWKRPRIETNGEVKEYPRRAGLSSFGAGGANAHVIIEEYISDERETVAVSPDHPAMIVLSAKNEERLEVQVRQLLGAIQEQAFTEKEVNDIAYTLQVGREAMEERLAVIVSSLKELQDKLTGFLEGKDDIEDLYRGQVKRNKETMAVLTADEDMVHTIDAWISKRKYGKLLDVWVKGLNLDWNRLYPGVKPHRISLPTYPFARERYWVPDSETGIASLTASITGTVIHPLVQQNTSDLTEQRFSTTLTGQEFFLTDHVVNGQRVLPGVAYLEMARAAVSEATREKDGTVIRLNNVVWSQPIVVGEQPLRVHIGLYPEDDGEIAYEIYREDEADPGESVVYSQGRATLSPAAGKPVLNLKALQEECHQGRLTSEAVYEAFRAMGIEYGLGHQGIEQVYRGEEQVLAELSLPMSVRDTEEQYVLHPGIMDAALQASLGLRMDSEDRRAALPFALQEIEIIGPCMPRMWAWIRNSSNSQAGDQVRKLDFDLCDEQGNVCIRMKELSSRVLGGETSSLEAQAAPGLLMLEPVWEEQEITRQSPGIAAYAQHLIILCGLGRVTSEALEERMKGVRCVCLQSPQSGIAERFQSYAARIFEEIQSLIKEKPKQEVWIQIAVPNEGERELFTGLLGLLKTAQIENPKLHGQLIEVEADEEADGLQEILETGSGSSERHIRYQSGKRLVAGWKEIEVQPEIVELPWKDQGVYLITGGMGGLGLLMAEEIAHRVQGAVLVLTGRSALNEARQAQLKELEQLGAHIEYRQVDVTDKQAVTAFIRSLQEQFGGIHGIIHSAGVIKDNFIIKKTKEEFEEVLAPKVAGLENLDQASQDVGLDFFILFSSLTGRLGNIGQADYATANAFMDAYAHYRNELVRLKQRQGRTISINWPLWQAGGMSVDQEREQLMRQNTGMIPMQTQTGIRALYQSLASRREQVMVMEGNLVKMKPKLLSAPATPESKEASNTPTSPVSGFTNNLLDKVQKALVQIMSKLLKVKSEDISSDVGLNEYGFDSITFTQYTNIINQEYQLELTPTIFFEYSTLDSFAKYLIQEHQAALVSKFAVISHITVPSSGKENITEIKLLSDNRQRSRFAGTHTQSAPQSKPKASEPIAIVGISGAFPMAGDLNEFWSNLAAGKDCISEIPEERWDWRKYFGDPAKEANKTNIKWGGFIEGIAEFDPLFFGISPREAELMDPQQRLLMTYVWKVIEDAGYSAQSLSGTQTGIFVGTANSGYSGLISQAEVSIEGYSSTGAVASMGPNRMSYFLNIHGPSEPVETACSSSLVAIHRAVNAIESGNCEMAIVGGINTLVTPEPYISFNKAGMLCEDGRCKTFSNRANGYVRGEGVGMLFLKKLGDAEQAGDHIYGVIRGTSENHGGRANSLTAPNPKAQAELLKMAYTKAGIDPRTVTYIEAHGTGTELGDPIEISGLKTAFKELSQTTGDSESMDAYCGLGSVKTNIGHLELAAGVAGVIKVLMQIKHRTLVKSLHCETVNPYIQLQDSPFYIVQETKEWKSIQDAKGQDVPRRAGVSSFGFGGANAHVVIEEYIPKERERVAVSPDHPVMMVLSAKNEERLEEQVRQLLSAIQEQAFSEQEIIDIAYTLQVGREAMEERLAVIVSSLKELQDKLTGFLEGKDDIEDLYRGQVKRNKETMSVFTADEDMVNTIDAWISKRKYGKLLDAWVKGLSIDWNGLYPGIKPHRISLPTYPFAKERYWVPERMKQSETTSISSQNYVRWDDDFYEQLIDQVIDDSISVDLAVRKVKEVMGG